MPGLVFIFVFGVEAFELSATPADNFAGESRVASDPADIFKRDDSNQEDGTIARWVVQVFGPLIFLADPLATMPLIRLDRDTTW